MSYYSSKAGWVEEGRGNSDSCNSDAEYQRHLQSLEEEHQNTLRTVGNKNGRKERSHGELQQQQQQHSSLQSALMGTKSHCFSRKKTTTKYKKIKKTKNTTKKLVTSFVIGKEKHGDINDTGNNGNDGNIVNKTTNKLVTNFMIGEKKCGGIDDINDNGNGGYNGDIDHNYNTVVGIDSGLSHLVEANEDSDNALMMDVECEQECEQSTHSNPETRIRRHHNHSINSLPQTKQYASSEFHEEQGERMEIDSLFTSKLPLLVLDGANVAYAYAQTLGGTMKPSQGSNTRNEPEVLGIEVAVMYFLNAGCRVQVVIPLSWMSRKPSASNSSGNGTVQKKRHVEILQGLQSRGMLCCSPPKDDDDAYCISIARRIDERFRGTRRQQNSSCNSLSLSSNSNDLTLMGGAYILSNDFYRDAMARDSSRELRKWLEGGKRQKWQEATDIDDLPHRISYSFCDLGSFDKYGDTLLDIMPNPRHPLIGMIERSNRLGLNNSNSL